MQREGKAEGSGRGGKRDVTGMVFTGEKRQGGYPVKAETSTFQKKKKDAQEKKVRNAKKRVGSG